VLSQSTGTCGEKIVLSHLECSFDVIETDNLIYPSRSYVEPRQLSLLLDPVII
jgi:hypothetical protein